MIVVAHREMAALSTAEIQEAAVKHLPANIRQPLNIIRKLSS
jgi:hypothetical protein